MATWEKNENGWRVFDDRLYSLTDWGARSYTYCGYSKREAMREHAETIRQLRRKGARLQGV